MEVYLLMTDNVMGGKLLSHIFLNKETMELFFEQRKAERQIIVVQPDKEMWEKIKYSSKIADVFDGVVANQEENEAMDEAIYQSMENYNSYVMDMIKLLPYFKFSKGEKMLIKAMMAKLEENDEQLEYDDDDFYDRLSRFKEDIDKAVTFLGYEPAKSKKRVRK